MKISAVVVTYNRLNDLKECIAALRKQTILCDIIVVNNGSTDRTKEYLDTINDIKVIHQTNLGGAGGFYTGTKYAYDCGYEWIWMMDDDGIPEISQLENLLNVANNNNLFVLNALVVNKNNHEQFAFNGQKKINSVDLTKDYIPYPLSPFNGTFIHRKIIEKVGFIKKEMFIWGDEQEYFARIRKAGYIPYTAVKAIHYHPCEKGKKSFAFPLINKGKVVEKPVKFSHHYYRNLGYLNKNYRGFVVLLKDAFYYTIFLFRKFRFKELIKFYKYYMNGILDKYNN